MQFEFDNESRVFEFWSFDLALKSKPRPRLSRGQHHVIMPREYMEWKKDIKNFLQSNIPELYSRKTTLYGPARLSVLVSYNNTRADVDNAAGGLMDAFNGVVWDDDRQVMELHVYKHTRKEIPMNFYCIVSPMKLGEESEE